MIYTVTMNPAIDCTLITSSPVRFGEMNRTEGQLLRFSGKGVNVSYVLRGMGMDSILWGFSAGFTGDALVRGLAEEGFVCDFVILPQGLTRVNVKIPAPADSDVSATEINSPGPVVDRRSLDVLERMVETLGAGDMLVLSGSLPEGVEADYVARLLSHLPEGAEAVCDLTGSPLRAALPCRPLLVKPNETELRDFLSLKSDDDLTEEMIREGASKLISMGAKNVLVSLGPKGAYFASESGVCGNVPTPVLPAVTEGETLSSVGCGDSAVAGWICGFSRTGSPEEAARLAVLCGSASYRFSFPADRGKVARLAE